MPTTTSPVPSPDPQGGERSNAAIAGRFGDLVRDLAAFARWRLVGLILLAMLAAVAEGVGLMLLVPLLDRIGIGGSQRIAGVVERLGIGGPAGLEPALAFYVVLVAAAAAVVQARAMAVTRLRLDYVDSLRSRLHMALMGMEWRAFTRLRGADVTHVMTMECNRSATGVEFLLRLAGWMVEVPALLLVAVSLSPPLAAALLLLAAVSWLLMRPFNRRTFALGQAAGEASRALQASLTDDIAGMRVVRSHGIEAARGRRFGSVIEALRERQLAHQRAACTARALTQAGAAALAALTVAVAVRGLGMALADTLVLIAAFARLMGAALRVQDAWRMVLHSLPAHAAARDMLARWRAAAEPVADSQPSLPTLSRDIRLEGVAYRPADDAAPALRGVDTTIAARAVTAVVGPSGAGKSTLADLLLGLATPSAGQILIDGRPLEGALRRAWRQRVGYVPQDSFLFHDSIRANLLAAAPGADETALWDALARAAADFVRALPQGLDTVVGDRGDRLSGGERQRLALARALLRNPDLLILDEATSALDAESEARVMMALEALRGSVTIVTIAHRPSTVRGADHVVILDEGRVADSGPWREVADRSATLLDRLAMLG